MNADEQFEKLCWEGLQRFLDKNPHVATFLGLHDPYDMMLPDGSSKTVFENLDLLKEWIGTMKKAVNFEELNDDHKIDWKAIEHTYEMARFSVYEHRMFETNPNPFEEIGGVLFVMLTRNYAPLEKRVEAIVSRLEKLPTFLEQFRTRFERAQPIKLWAEVAIESCQQMQGFFQFIVSATKDMISEELHGKLTKTATNLQQPITQHLEWLKSLLSKSKMEWALGKEKFNKLLKLRGLGMTADEILKLGVRYLNDLKDERARLAEQIAPGKGVEAVRKDIESNAPKSFEEALRATQEEVEKSRRFVIENDIATVPSEDILHVKETPAFMSPLIPFAAMIPSAKFDKKQERIYIVTRPRDIKSMGKDLNYATIPVTAVHEGFPGHFLHSAQTNRGSFVRLIAHGIEVVEGWAHYCEEMMTEHGFINSLESRFMQVNDGILRATRIIVDVKLSTGEMSFQEAVDMLVKETGMSREAAVVEVRRYTQNPAYQLSYLIGKHLILQLREEVKQRMGDKYSEKFFHDTVTTSGNLPIFLLREVFDVKLARQRIK